jgi:GNAT superfamily N-acetyltransferase
MKSDAILVLATHGAERLDVVRKLRYEVLREPLGMPYEDTLFPGDELPTTQHWLAYADNQPLGCLTLLFPDAAVATYIDDPIQVQLRGMAVLEQTQGRGIGSRMLAEVHRLAIAKKWHLWCNARQAAVPFYSKNGWHVQGQPFDIPKIGPHFVMCWEPRE